ISWRIQTGAPLRAARLTTSSFDQFLLAATTTDGTLHVAKLDSSSGLPTEVASLNSVSPIPLTLFWAVVNNRAFLFTTDGSVNLKVYEYTSSGSSSSIAYSTQMTSSSDTFFRAVVRGTAGSPYPALLVQRYASNLPTFLDIYDTTWVTQGG